MPGLEPGPVAVLADEAEFPSLADGLEPSEGFLDPFPFPLRHPISAVAGGASIDRGPAVRGVLRDMGGEPGGADIGDEPSGVVALVAAHGASPFPAREPSQHLRRAIAFREPVAAVSSASTRSPGGLDGQHGSVGSDDPPGSDPQCSTSSTTPTACPGSHASPHSFRSPTRTRAPIRVFQHPARAARSLFRDDARTVGSGPLEVSPRGRWTRPGSVLAWARLGEVGALAGI